MNIALEQTEEHVNGVVTNRYGDAFIRGNNGLSILLSLQFRVNLRLSLSSTLHIGCRTYIAPFTPIIRLAVVSICAQNPTLRSNYFYREVQTRWCVKASLDWEQLRQRTASSSPTASTPSRLSRNLQWPPMEICSIPIVHFRGPK